MTTEAKNLRSVVPNPAKRPAPPQSKPRETPKIVRILELARTWQALPDRGEVRTHAALAKRAELCAVYVRWLQRRPAGSRLDALLRRFITQMTADVKEARLGARVAWRGSWSHDVRRTRIRWGVDHSIEGEVDVKSIFKRLVKPVTFADGAIPEVARTATSGAPALSGQLRQRYALLLASFVATSAIACGAEDPSVMDESELDVGKIAQDITGGTRVADNSGAPRSSVVKIQIGGLGGITCTGLKVGPLLYLTANHCGFVQGQLVTTTNALDGNFTNDHSIVQVFDHPTDFLSRVNKGTIGGPQWDLTLFQVDYDDGIPIHTPTYAVESAGDTGTFFGYGCDNVNTGNSGWKQFGISPPTASFNNSMFSAPTRPQVCQGDSGGPFFKIVSGAYRLAGINRALDAGTGSYWNRIYGASQWIDAVRAGLPGINVLTNGSQGTFLSKTSDFCMGSFFNQQTCRFLESADQRFTVVVSGGQLQFVGQGANAGQCLGVPDSFSGTHITHVTCGTPQSKWTTQNPDASGRYMQYKNVFAQHCMRSVSLGTDFGPGYDQQPCSNTTDYPDQYFVFSK